MSLAELKTAQHQASKCVPPSLPDEACQAAPDTPVPVRRRRPFRKTPQRSLRGFLWAVSFNAAHQGRS